MGRTTIVLAVIATLMLAFIIVYERGTISSRELEQRKDRVLKRFVRARVTGLEIKRGKTSTVLVREADEEGDLELGSWRLKKPFSAEADQEAVENLLGELEWLDPERTLHDITEQDRERFGLNRPRLRAFYTVNDRRIPIVIGKEDTKGEGVYLQLDDVATAFVVGKEIVEALDREPGFFYTKELHDGVSVYSLRSITLRDEHGERVVEKRGDDFWLTRPALALASADAVGELIQTLDDLRAKRFVAEKVEDAAAYGLETPVFEAVVEKKVQQEAAGAVTERPSSLRFRLGARCGEHEGQSYIVVGEQGPVMCVADEDLVKAQKGRDALREKRLLALQDSAIKSVDIAAGTRKLQLREDDSKWSFTAWRGGRTVASGKADQEALEKWLKKLRAVEATRFLPADESVLRQGRLRQPGIKLSFARSGDASPFEVRIGLVDEQQMFAQRAGEPEVVIFPAPSSDLLAANSARFRQRRLLDEKEDELWRLQIKRGETVELLVRNEEGDWSIEKPIKAEADQNIVEQAAGAFSRLEAQRFVDDTADPAHGLEQPSMLITAHFTASSGSETGPDKKTATDEKQKQEAPAAERTHTLRLGDRDNGGRYGQLDDDDAVFVVSEQLLQLVDAPLVSRSLLGTPLEQIERLKIENQGAIVEIRRQGEQFTVVGQQDPQSERAAKIAQALAGLRASGVAAYENRASGQELQSPGARVTVTRTSDAPDPLSYQLLFGDSAPGGESGPQQYVRRSDLPVRFTVPVATVNKLLDFND